MKAIAVLGLRVPFKDICHRIGEPLCGHKFTSKFCGECGSKRREYDALKPEFLEGAYKGYTIFKVDNSSDIVLGILSTPAVEDEGIGGRVIDKFDNLAGLKRSMESVLCDLWELSLFGLWCVVSYD